VFKLRTREGRKSRNESEVVLTSDKGKQKRIKRIIKIPNNKLNPLLKEEWALAVITKTIP
jgi:hypothetical protein